MTTQRDSFEEQCAGYVLGALSTEEGLEFERTLQASGPEEQQIYAEMSYASLHLPLAIEWVEPPPHIKVKILQAILPEPEPPPSFWEVLTTNLGLRRLPVAWSAACLFLISAVGVSIYSGSNLAVLETKEQALAQANQDLRSQTQANEKLSKTNKSLRTDLKKTKKALKQSQLKIARLEDVIKVLRGRKVQLVAMGGLGKYKEGYGKVIWNASEQRAVLQIANLTARNEEKDFQLWLIPKSRRRKPVSAGTFPTTQANKERFFEIPKKYIPKVPQRRRRRRFGYKLFAVTIEKKGGAPQPTMKPILVGRIRL